MFELIKKKKEELKSPVRYNFANGKYLASVINDSATTCDEIIELYNEETKTISTNSNEKKGTSKMKNVFILLNFY